MLDNKQRAHDLAILLTEYQLKNAKDSIDVYKIYLEIYKQALESFNRDFPDEQ